jgi:hypothetical protein
MASTAGTEYSRIGKQRGAAPLLIQKGRFQQQRSQVTVTSHGVEQCVLVRDMLDVGCQDMLDTARRLRGAHGWTPRLLLADLSVVEQRYRAVLAVQCAVVW